MLAESLKSHIESLFHGTKFSDKDNNLYLNKIIEAVEKIDTCLVEILIKDDKAKKHFFSKVLDTYVMNQFKLIDFFSMNNYFEESFTSYTNKIGLIRKDDFIKKNNDVVLAFPYKDCVLEGGQTKEDQKGKENFFNEILDSDEIDRLFEPKVLTNIKRYSKDGIEENPTISEQDNLILKGNNLLALHSLKKKYAGKIKLIYIDPPYNTENDSFKYNDNFTRSSWLTFMKNRLEVAKDLLSNDGFILMQTDHHQCHYLKILADEIFQEKNFRNEIVWSYRTGGIPKSGMLPRKHDVIYLYSKNESSSFTLPKERQYLEKDFMGSSIDEDGNYYVDTNLRDVIEGILKIKNGNEIIDYNTRPVLNVSTENIDGFKSQKPEGFIRLLLDIFLNKGDIVLDFFSGTGTTQRVAHKLNLQYIGVEQMGETVNEILIPNLLSALKGDQTGISKSVNWQGGGDFIYAELKQVANFDKSNSKLKQEMRYLPIGELEDEDYKISKEEIAINKAFYGVNDE